MMQTTVSIHHGSYESIPADASPGLIFLQRFMPVVDAINPGQCSITSFFTPSAPILINSNPPSSASQAVPLLHVRSRHLAHFHHKVHIAWDIDLSSETGPVPSSQPVSADAITDVNTVASEETTLYAPLTSKVRMKRTVMFEATSETVFKNDPDHFPVKTREFNILDLEGANQDDLQVVEMRVFLDSKPVQARAASLSMASAYADG
ncbi:hypothetical protein N7462_001236 [Penicillium macrosclerotiorum]|uniref:uncharacterized protein n=1 Tax=Penicillium macrosclerotiorum TaxID=303699 RepID=UPI0025481EED|nr:uncharacterized protein N7462_001236 [Penicillium macrosclerotiorum]KAJ5691813.1 hypothetical protein N7462_001236 [Penicillium macrosclerotiorum]